MNSMDLFNISESKIFIYIPQGVVQLSGEQKYVIAILNHNISNLNLFENKIFSQWTGYQSVVDLGWN